MTSSENRFPLTISDVHQLIPHRYPFLMIDRVLGITEKKPGEIVGRVCTAQKNISGNEPFFTGHFPDNPVMPGVLIVEAIAQAGAICCCGVKEDPPIKQLFFAGVDNVRFKKPVVPGDILKIEVEMQKQKASFYWGKGTAYIGEAVVAYADILAHITFDK